MIICVACKTHCTVNFRTLSFTSLLFHQVKLSSACVTTGLVILVKYYSWTNCWFWWCSHLVKLNSSTTLEEGLNSDHYYIFGNALEEYSTTGRFENKVAVFFSHHRKVAENACLEPSYPLADLHSFQSSLNWNSLLKFSFNLKCPRCPEVRQNTGEH